MRSSHAELIAKILREPPILKPVKHEGGPWTDYYRVEISQDAVSEIVQELLSAETNAVAPNGFTTPQAPQRAALVDKWGDYLHWLPHRHA
jgi:hypothetical protein